MRLIASLPKRMRPYSRLAAAFVLLATVTNCGGTTGTGWDFGYFLGSEIVNAGYEIRSTAGAQVDRTGRTGEDGSFLYRAGDEVTFFVGNLRFPSVKANRYVTVVDMSPTNTIDDRVSVNAERLLLSLDADAILDLIGDLPVPGIEDGNVPDIPGIPNIPGTISEVIRNLIGDIDLDAVFGDEIRIAEELWVIAEEIDIDIDFSLLPDQFENQPSVLELLRYVGSSATKLVDERVAKARLWKITERVAQLYRSTTTVEQLLDVEPAMTLDADELLAEFGDRYFVDIDREFWWHFASNGTITVASTVGRTDVSSVPDDVWEIRGDQLCHVVDGLPGCRTVYKSGDTYRYSRIDAPEKLERLILRSVDARFGDGFPPCCPTDR